MDPVPFAHVLHAALAAGLGRAPMLRGRRYFAAGRVAELERRGSRVTARVRGGSIYDVALWVKGEGVGYVCSCPAGGAGDFCKHCVAVALAWLERCGVAI